MMKRLAPILLIAAFSAVSCHWHLHTRTPPKTERAAAPAFSLPDEKGNLHTLPDLLAKGPGVIVFYRGYW